MRTRISVLSVVPFLAFLGACGGSSHNTMPNEVPVVVSISDQPSNLGVLSFDLQITGACFLTSSNAMATSCSGAQNLLPGVPMTVQLENLQTPQQLDVLATTNLQAGTYTAVLITFGTATAVVNVDPNTTDQDSATPPNSCSAGGTPTVCKLSPTFTTSSVNLPFPSAATLSAGQPTSVSIEFSVADSLVGAAAGNTTTFTITPTIAVSVTTAAGANGSLIEVNNVTGPVTDVETTGFTVADAATGQPVTVATFTGTTIFTGFSNCNSSIACVQVGQIVSVNYAVSDSSPLVLSASSVTNNIGFQNGQAFEGTVVATTPTPMVLVTEVLAGNTQGVTAGQVLTLVLPTSSAGFSIAVPAGQTLPTSDSFAATGDLVVGQNVLIDSTSVDTGVVTSDAIALEPSQFRGTVSSITSPNLTVNGLNNFFNDNGIATVQIQTGTQTTFGGTVATSGFKGLTVGDEANFDGFLFSGGAGQSPIVFGENIFDEGSNGSAAKKVN